MKQNAIAFALVGVMLSTASHVRADEDPASRTFLFTYRVDLKDLPPGEKVRVWLPVPPTNEDQVTEAVETSPGGGREAREPVHSNTVFFWEGDVRAAGSLSLTRVYKVTRKAVSEDRTTRLKKEVADLYLRPNARVPNDGKPLTLLKGKALPDDPRELGRAFFDLVNDHMRYSKEGTGWGRGDALWACDSKYGNCTDFHSLFMSLARSRNLPVKFEIGFSLPPKRGEGEISGYHCWAKFSPGGVGWVPVDISEANKDAKNKDQYFGRFSPDRVTFSVGRDLTLVPKQDGPPLNFFIDPYVEVDGKPLPAAKVLTRFSFKDLEGNK